MNQATIHKAFERFLRQRGFKLTPQRERIFGRAFATHEHFSAETLYDWMRTEDGLRTQKIDDAAAERLAHFDVGQMLVVPACNSIPARAACSRTVAASSSACR